VFRIFVYYFILTSTIARRSALTAGHKYMMVMWWQIDQCGKEEALERGYRAAVAAAALPAVRYEPFDFHTECRGMRYHRLHVLIDRITHEQVPHLPSPPPGVLLPLWNG
jgi:hypothetical protein